jgi:hypothetical protein
MRTAAVLLSAVVLLGCMQRADLADPTLGPFADMYAIDREPLGLTPMPHAGPVQVERHSGADATRRGYDAMLHLAGATARTVAFERAGGGYRWLGEQEITYGPREYDTPDGRLREFVVITYYRRAVDGQPAGLNIDYRGPDERFVGRSHNLTPSDVRPLLDEWRRR